MTQSLNNNIYPKGGYQFKDSDGTVIHADSWAGVIKRVALYRKRAGYPPGNPQEEVVAQACAKNPVICNQDPASHKAALNRQPLKGRVLMWLNGLRADQGRQFVDEAVTRQRALICAGCPHNKEAGGGCASCRAAIKLLREEVIGRRFQDGRINACDVLGEDLPSSTNLEVQAVENADLPAYCWRRRSI